MTTATGQRCSASTIWPRTISHPLAFFDANGTTIRQVLGMRSGIPGLNEFTPEGGSYPAEQASTAVKVFKERPEPEVAPGGEPDYASTNYVLLGTSIEHVTGRTLALTSSPSADRLGGISIHVGRGDVVRLL